MEPLSRGALGMESLGAIRRRIESGNGTIQAKAGVYKGVTFRSQLEIRYSMYLDLRGVPWVYEPRIYGHDDVWYLPDFQILGGRRPIFIELKPKLDEVDGAKAKMSVIWREEPDATLIVACAEECRYFAALRDGDWETWQERWPSHE